MYHKKSFFFPAFLPLYSTSPDSGGLENTVIGKKREQEKAHPHSYWTQRKNFHYLLQYLRLNTEKTDQDFK